MYVIEEEEGFEDGFISAWVVKRMMIILERVARQTQTRKENMVENVNLISNYEHNLFYSYAIMLSK
mgnify:CR=1 FL=1